MILILKVAIQIESTEWEMCVFKVSQILNFWGFGESLDCFGLHFGHFRALLRKIKDPKWCEALSSFSPGAPEGQNPRFQHFK